MIGSESPDHKLQSLTPFAFLFKEGADAWEESNRYLTSDKYLTRAVLIAGMTVAAADVALSVMRGGGTAAAKTAVKGGVIAAKTLGKDAAKAVIAHGSEAIDAIKGLFKRGADAIPTIGGRKPINSRYAGKTHPSGVKFNKQGFPDFSPHAKAKVKIDHLTGDYKIDESLANQAMGYPSTPKGHVWHHVEDGKTMQLIPQDIHNAVRHTGGAAVIRNGGLDQ